MSYLTFDFFLQLVSCRVHVEGPHQLTVEAVKGLSSSSIIMRSKIDKVIDSMIQLT